MKQKKQAQMQAVVTVTVVDDGGDARRATQGLRDKLLL